MKRISCFLLCILLLCLAPVTPARAEYDFDVGQNWDQGILAGGIYDLYAWVGDNADDYTYQWQADAAFGDGSWFDLEDNANPYGYSGTDTYHMEFITQRADGQIVGSGWETIPFRCLITHKQTGVTKATASMFMNIYTSSDLPDYLERQGFGLYEPTINGAADLKTSDDVNYTATAFAGTQLQLVTGCWRPNSNHLLRQSNFTEDIEIWITENGKTLKVGNDTKYTPYTIGTNAVTIAFKLHHALGIHDLGYYETKTVKLSTKEPDGVAYGTTKNDISLLKERYNESQKLSAIPKGTKLKVTEKAANWCQVVYNGYLGYVATSALTLDENIPIIDHVDVTITEPVAGNLPATTCTVTPNSCTATYIDWEDRTEDRFMNPGEAFQKGHSYRLIIWVTAKDGYEFKLDSSDKMLATATINQKLPAFTTRAYEQIIGKVMELTYDFNNVKEEQESHTCTPVLVPRVAPTCTKAGHEAYYKCACGMQYRDSQGKHAVDASVWGVLPATGHTPGNWRYNTAEHYRYCSQCGEMLATEAHNGGKATCAEKGKCAVCGYGYLPENENHTPQSKWTACGALYHAHLCDLCGAHCDPEEHLPGPAATETEPQTCKVCNFIITPAKNHTHELTKVAEIPATCTKDGLREHYTCSGCPELFADAAAAEKIPEMTALVIPALGHTQADSWGFDDLEHWRFCASCNEPMTETSKPHDLVDGICSVCGYTGQPVQPSETEAPTTQPTEAPAIQPTMPADKAEKPDGTNWLLLVLVGLVLFAAALTATVLVLKKKNK